MAPVSNDVLSAMLDDRPEPTPHEETVILLTKQWDETARVAAAVDGASEQLSTRLDAIASTAATIASEARLIRYLLVVLLCVEVIRSCASS